MFDAAEAALGPMTGLVVTTDIVAPAAGLPTWNSPGCRVLDVNVLCALLTAR